jgi:hypothetical protein
VGASALLVLPFSFMFTFQRRNIDDIVQINGNARRIFGTVHGTALGMVLEPGSVKELPDEARKQTWQVCIGSVAPGMPASKEDLEDVIHDLRDFCINEGFMPHSLL